MDEVEYLQDYIDVYEYILETIKEIQKEVKIKEFKDWADDIRRDFESFEESYIDSMNDLEEMSNEESENEYEERCHEYWSDQF